MDRSSAHRRLHQARIRDCGLLLLCLLGWLFLYVGFRPEQAYSSAGSLISVTAGQSAEKVTTVVMAGEARRRTDHAGTSSLAYRQSFGFFHDMSDEDWTRRQKRARTHRHQASASDKKITEGLEANRWYMNNYFPLFTCPDQRRVGVGGDGPKWTCDPHRLALPRVGGGGGVPGTAKHSDNNKCLVYSIGSNGNYIFEEGLVKLLGAGTCEIHVFDMSQDYARDSDKEKGIHFHHWGLGSSYSNHGRKKGFKYMTLKETMEKLGHVNRTIDVFKIDCEKCEWTSYKDWISDAVDIRQLLIETHGIPTDLGVNPADFFEDIERAGFAMFSKEPNIHPVVSGRCVEWGYVKLRKEFFGSRFAVSSQS